MIKLVDTQRGFARGDFKDAYEEKCSIQESSVGSNLWLGCNHETKDLDGVGCGARMHLTQKMVADLIPLLQRFVDTGRLR